MNKQSLAGATVETLPFPVDDERGVADLDSQINIPPPSPNRLWTAVTAALRCPACGSRGHKAETGKRSTADGFTEHYRRCARCAIRFRVVFE